MCVGIIKVIDFIILGLQENHYAKSAKVIRIQKKIEIIDLVLDSRFHLGGGIYKIYR